MTETLTITTPDGGFQAYLARPATTPAAAVVVIQEIFGVNAVMRQVADDLADQGFLAIVPDLFWRLEPGVQLTDKSQADWDRAFALLNAFDIDMGVEDIQATITAVRHHRDCTGKVGSVGFCLGGKLAYLTATRTDVDASVGYYGLDIDSFVGEAERLHSPLMLHIAQEDQFVPKAAQDRMIAGLNNHPHAQLFSYPGVDHAFAREGGDHYDATAAAAANARTLELFKTSLVG